MTSTFIANDATNLNTVMHGDCVEVMCRMHPGSIDFVITDPPYITRYCARDGRTVANDDNARWLKPVFAQMHRLLKSAAFRVIFYGWNKADLFIDAWRAAGFRIAGHVVSRKRLCLIGAVPSLSAQTGVLAGKRRRATTYTADTGDPRISLHRQQAAPDARNRLPLSSRSSTISVRRKARCWTPSSGSGSALVATRQLGRQCIGIEIDEQHHRAPGSTKAGASFARGQRKPRR